MHFCSNCGTQVDDGAEFCPSCNSPQQSGPTAPPPAADPKDFTEKFEKFNDTPDSTGEFDPKDIQDNKVMAVLAYLSWLVLIPIFAAKQSPYARYHVNQGLVLAIVEIIWGVVYRIVDGIWILDGIFSAVNWLIGIVFFVFSVLGIVNAVNGKAKELPIIGGFKIFK